MRYWFASLLIVFFMVAATESQDTKKKDKETDKKKDIGKKKEDDPKSGTTPEITEVMGRSFKDWQKEIHSKDPSKRESAMKTILLFGPQKAYDAVPDILTELEKHTISKTTIDLSVRVNGTMTLSTIFKYKKDPDPKHVQRAVAIYRNFLRDDQLILKIRAVQGLIFYGPACREALPEVTKIAATKDSLTWEARKEAVEVLGMLGFSDAGVPSGAVIADVMKAIDDPSYQVRIAALHSIARLGGALAGPEARIPLISRLNSALQAEEDLQVVITLHLSIMTLEKKVTPKHLNPIIKLAKHKDSGVRLAAVQSLAVTGKDGKVAVPTLLETVHDPEVNIGVAAINSLLSLDADELIPHMKKIKSDKNANPVLHDAAVEALELIAQRDKMRKESKDKKDKK